MMTVALLLALAPPIVAPEAHDSAGQGAHSQVVAAVVRCRAVGDAAERLACYDRAVASLEQAQSSDQIVILDKDEVRKTRRSLFGFSLPNIKLFGGNDKHDEQLDRIDTSVVSLTRDGDGRLVFTTPEGATWHQIDDRPNFAVRRGTKVTIKTALFGSYFAEFSGTVSVKVRRDR